MSEAVWAFPDEKNDDIAGVCCVGFGSSGVEARSDMVILFARCRE